MCTSFCIGESQVLQTVTTNSIDCYYLDLLVISISGFLAGLGKKRIEFRQNET